MLVGFPARRVDRPTPPEAAEARARHRYAAPVVDSETFEIFKGASAAAKAPDSTDALVEFWAERYAEMIAHIDELITPFLRPDFFFVNVGANDGVTGDPIYPFIKRYGWQGIAVEPAPPVCERLRANYADLPGVIVEQAAITRTPTSFWYIEPHEGAPEHIVSGIGSLDRDNVLHSIRILQVVDAMLPPQAVVLPGEARPVGATNTGDEVIGPGLIDHLVEVPVQCLTIPELLAKHDVARVDMVNIDAEGFDYQVLDMFDLEHDPPALICIETAEMDSDDERATTVLLDRHGYELRGAFGLLSTLYVRT